MANEIIKGRDFMFSVVLPSGTEMICHATDFTLNVDTKELETTGPNNGLWASFIPAGNSYTLSVPGVVSYTSAFNLLELQELQYANAIFDWIAGVAPDGGLQYSGQMFITNTTMTTQFRDAVRFDMSARGTGQQNILRSPFSRTVYLANTSGIRLPGCPNPYPVGVLWYDGTLIGVANNADDVVAIFNDYSITQGNYLTLTGYVDGCDFTMVIQWNSPLRPTFIPAVTGSGFVIGGRMAGEVIGESDSNHNVIGA